MLKCKHVIFLTYVAIILLGCGCTQSEKEFPPLQDQYLGLKPPGDDPEVFAPGIVSDENWAEHCQVAISPNGDEIF